MGPEIELIKEVPAQTSLPELVATYCSNVNNTALIFIALGVLFWLLEPSYVKFIKRLENKNNTFKYILTQNSLKFMYKWIGLGMLFMSGYLIWMV
jgi:hypothetical protein